MRIIYSEWLDTEIAIFDTVQSYLDCAEKHGIPPYDMPDGTLAFYQFAKGKDGKTFFMICFVDGKSSLETVVHETSHLTDCLFEWRGFEACTETRAYFHAWLFKEVLKTGTLRGGRLVFR
jgi:hypothetical protein